MTISRVRIGHGAGSVEVPAIGQGTWHMGEDRHSRGDEVKALQHGIDLGLRLIDSAEMYADGGAEEVVGEAMQGRRDEVFLVSKVYPWNAGRDSAIRACEASLKRLGTDHVDLYLLHWPGNIPLEETLEAFERLADSGKIRHFGVSNFDIDEMQALAALPGAEACAVNQVLYHLASRGIEVALRPWMQRQQMPIMAYCPLAQAGSYGSDPLHDPHIVQLAAELSLSPAQLLLAWVTRKTSDYRDVIAIPKATSLAHVADNAKALDIELDTATLARLDELFPVPSRKVPLDIV